MKKMMGLVVLVVMVASVASAEWHYGIGTGLTALNVQGDVGLNVRPGGVGPVQFDVDLEPDDISDLMETAFGLGGYATDGTWMIKASSGFMELRDGTSKTLPNGVRVDGELFFETTLAELSVGYSCHRSENIVVTPYIGARYMNHEVGADFTVAGNEHSRSVEYDWADARVGVAIDVPLCEKLVWGTSVEAGFGGSDGTYQGDTGVMWVISQHWATRLGFKYAAVDFENGEKGDDDWYLYDVEEFGSSLSVFFNW
jgi:hypothetical protein